MIKNINAITGATYLSMLFLGVASSLVGAVAKNIGLTPYQIGMLITVQNIGFGIAVSVAGALSDTHDKPKIVIIGGILLGAAFLVFYSSGLFWVNLLIMLLFGLGQGTFEGTTDAMLLDMHTEKAGLHINVNHFFVTMGSVAIALYLMFLQMNWRQAMVQSSIVILLLVVFFFLVRLRRKEGRTPGFRERARLLVRERTVAVPFVAMVLCVGVQLSTMGVLTTYLVDVRHFSLSAARIALVIFPLGMATGRLFIGFFTPRERMTRWILGLFALSAALFAALYLLNLARFTFAVVYLAGLAISALLPLMLAFAGLTYRQAAGMVMGALKIGIPVGGIVMPFLVSMVSKNVSFEAALFLFPGAFVLGLLLFLATGYWQPLTTLVQKPS